MSRRGSNAVEFGLLVPVLAMMVSGVVDLGQVLLIAESVVEAVADGAQAGSLVDESEGGNSITTAKAVTVAAFTTSEVPGTLVATAAKTTPSGGTILTVTGTVSFTPIFGFTHLPTTVTCKNAMRLMYP